MQKKFALLLSLAVMAGSVMACGNDDNNNNENNSCTQNVCDGSVLNICSGGKFVAPYTCQFGCSNGACVAEPGLNCSEGSMQCSLTNVPQKCVGNTWVDQTPCVSGQTCSNGACINGSTPSVCTAGTAQCANDKLAQVCIGNTWVDMNCPDLTECANGTCVPVQVPPDPPVCNDGAKQCSTAGVPQLCSQNVWFDQNPCDAGESCTNGECVAIPACNDGDKSCSSNGTPLLCVDGSLIEQAACANGLICNAATGECDDPGTIVCSEGAKQCSESGVPQTCIKNAWVDGTACVGTETCENGVCKGGSIPTDCGDDETDVNGVCVPNDMLNAADDSICEDAWKEVEFCDNNGNAVYCATDSENKVRLAREACSDGCKLGNMGDSEEPYYASFCDNEYSAKCASGDDSFGYCIDEEDFSYESAYMCVEALGGGFVAVDISMYGYYDFCDGVCDDKGEACGVEVTTCTKDSDCKSGEVCSEGVCIVEGGCKTDADCSGNTPYCDDYFGTCAPCIGGEADKGCLDTTKVCKMDSSTWEFVCVDDTGCTKDSDCIDGMSCVNGACVADVECKTDADCDDGEACVNGACVADVECKTDADCDAGEACVEGACVASSGCKTDADCENGQTCVEGVCVDDVECKTDADCDAGEACVDGACIVASFDVVRSIVLPGEFVTTKDAYAQSIATTVDGVNFAAVGNLYNANINKGLGMTNRTDTKSHIEVTGATGIGTIKFTLMRRTNTETGIYNVIIDDDETTKKTIDLKSLSADEAKTLTFTFNNANAKSFKVVPASYNQSSNKYRMFVSKVEWTSIK